MRFPIVFSTHLKVSTGYEKTKKIDEENFKFGEKRLFILQTGLSEMMENAYLETQWLSRQSHTHALMKRTNP